MARSKDSFNELEFYAKQIVDFILVSATLESLKKHHIVDDAKVVKTKDGYDIYYKPKRPIEYIELNFIVDKDGARFLEKK
jgi:hypothetical protein